MKKVPAYRIGPFDVLDWDGEWGSALEVYCVCGFDFEVDASMGLNVDGDGKMVCPWCLRTED